ncbi:MAG TPA: MCE family protein [Dermatophilaceae bacterium]|nr:MCE family protein [Dermatophilaceae bacterium]
MNRRAGMPRRGPRAMAVAAAMVLTMSLTACQGVYDLPLPGGAAAGGDVYQVTAEFADVLDLVPQSSVKVNQVTVGTVEKIELNGWTARVTVRLPTSVKLPDNAIAELKQTSLLGEKYVQLERPTRVTPTGALSNGDNIPLASTGRNTEVEEVLSALSLLLNGGGVAQLKVIQSELSDALGGNETQIRDLITQLNTFVGGLEKQKAEIVRAIDGIDVLSARIAARKDDLAAALEALPKGLKVLADQRKQLTAMLTALSNLGAVGTKVITATKADTLANLRALAPVLGKLASAGDNLPKSFQLLLTYPFPDEAMNTIKGDYTNLYATADLDLRNVAGNLGAPALPGAPSLPKLPKLPLPPLPTPAVPPVLPTGPKPAPSTCTGLLCLGLGGQPSWQASGSTDQSGGGNSPDSAGSWMSLMRTGGAA